MPLNKSPDDYSLLMYAFVMSLASFGAFVNNINRHYRCLKCAITSMIVDCITSTFIGLIVFWLCEEIGFSPLRTAVLVALSGHAGTRVIFLLQNYFLKRISVANAAIKNENT
jgi:hypothetical protein